MPDIISSDGFYSRVRFQMKRFDSLGTAYLTGDFNCWGEGSMILSGKELLSSEIELPPGRYGYSILLNQYHKYLENGRPTRKRSHLELKLEKAYHNPHLSQFSCLSDGLMELRIAVPRETKKIELLCKGKVIFKNRTRVGNYDVTLFVVESPGEYSFMVDDERLPLSGYYYPKNSTKRAYESSGIFYQIFPDRFYRGAGLNGKGFEEWGTKPLRNNFFGGTIRGIIEKLDYLKTLGVEYIYINPIFKANTNHRYDVSDYYEIDPILGNIDSLKQLISESHNRGMKVILDMVFNQSSTTVQPFQDAIKKGKNSEYYDWYIFHSNDFSVYTGRYKSGSKENEPPYETFMGVGMLPKLNHANKEVRDYFRQVILYYGEELSVDGFRFDVAHSIYLDFFMEIDRDLLNKDKLILGEAWCLSPIFLKGRYWNSITNYYMKDAIISYVKGSIDIYEFYSRFEKYVITTGRTEMERVMNILDSHDTVRILNRLGGSKRKVKLAFAFLYLLTGLPTIYYGDEVGLEGGRDPDDRRCFPWSNKDEELLSFIKKLGDFRIKHDIAYGGAMSYTSSANSDVLIRYKKDCQVRLYVAKKRTNLPTSYSDSLVIKYSEKNNSFLDKGDFGLFVVPNE